MYVLYVCSLFIVHSETNNLLLPIPYHIIVTIQTHIHKHIQTHTHTVHTHTLHYTLSEVLSFVGYSRERIYYLHTQNLHNTAKQSMLAGCQ